MTDISCCLLVNEHEYEKSPSLIGKSTVSRPCSIALCVFTKRVYHVISILDKSLSDSLILVGLQGSLYLIMKSFSIDPIDEG